MRPSRAVGASFGPALLALTWLTAGELAADPPTAMASTGGPPPPAVEYTLDPSSSALYVQVHKDPATLAAGLSHDHVVTSTGWSGRVRWDPADVAACAVSITVPVSGLVNDEPAMRTRVGYDTLLDDGQRATVKEHMLGQDQLDALSFPDITFTSTGCTTSGAQVIVAGTMSIHGVGKTVAARMTITADGTTFAAKGTLSANTTDFGFQPYSALLGQLRNLDALQFTIEVRGRR